MKSFGGFERSSDNASCSEVWSIGFILLLISQDISDGGESQESTSSSSALEDLMSLTTQKKPKAEVKVSPDRLQFMKEKKAEGWTIEQISRAWIKKQREEADKDEATKEPFFPSSQHKSVVKAKADKETNKKDPKNPKNSDKKAKKKTSKAKPPVVSSTYQPGSFWDARVAFMKKKRAKGFTHKEACDLWMCSNKRASLLSDLPENELKRRRFA